MAWYYHYTDRNSLLMIQKSGYIKSSRDETFDCRFGVGVYLTTLDPKQHSKEYIAKNNYEKGWRRGLVNGKTDSFIKIYIPRGDSMLKKAEDPQYPHRDVYLYAGDLYLSDYPNHKFCHVSEWGPSEERRRQNGGRQVVKVVGGGATGAVVGGLIGGPIGAIAGGFVGGFFGNLTS